MLTLDKVLTADPSEPLWQLVPEICFRLGWSGHSFHFQCDHSSPQNLFVISDQ